MYSQTAIDTLISRIGWSDNSDLPVAVNASNKTSDSGKYFNFFHPLVSVDNLYDAVDKVNMDEVDFNDYLAKLRSQAVLKMLTDILDKHHKYDATKDYSSILTERVSMFDDAIGYCVAIKAIEMFISSKRSNLSERNAKMAYNTLKIELEGAKNDNGHFVARGLLYHYEQACKRARKVIFPIEAIVQNGNFW